MARTNLILPLLCSAAAFAIAVALPARAVVSASEGPARWQVVRISDDWAIVLNNVNGETSVIGRRATFETRGFIRASIDIPPPSPAKDEIDAAIKEVLHGWVLDRYSDAERLANPAKPK
jgi:hypothetical protein